MDENPSNLGRAYIVGELRKKNVSKRMAVMPVNFVIREMSLTLKQDREVEFSFGRLVRVKKESRRRRERIGIKPINARRVEHVFDQLNSQSIS